MARAGEVALGVAAAAAAAGLIGYLVGQQPAPTTSSSGGGGTPSLVAEMNGESGTVDIPLGTSLEFSASGGTPNGPMTIFQCSTPSASSKCVATRATFGPKGTIQAGVIAAHPTSYWAAYDATTKTLSNWVEVVEQT